VLGPEGIKQIIAAFFEYFYYLVYLDGFCLLRYVMLTKGFPILLICVFLTFRLWATHNRAGEITYVLVAGLTYEATVTTYTKDSAPADREELEIVWGDGSVDTLQRTNGALNQLTNIPEGEIITDDVRMNIYKGTHTYPGNSTYTISVEDPNRNSDVVNIPNSVNTPFYIESVLVINPFLGYNNSPVLLNPPIDDAGLFKLYIHNPSAYDIDGDSLSYELIPCKGEAGNDIPNYTYPTATSSITIDAITGDLVWDTPNLIGEYNVAILVKEWRYGAMIGSLIRDMQIDVINTDNDPPVIDAPVEICVEAGTLIEFDVTATDPNNDKITLMATGGPLETSDPASFVQPVQGTGSVTSPFEWQTQCSHVRKQPYQIVFKAEDNNADLQLVDLHTLEITVVGPAPENPLATPIGNSVQLSWDVSKCSEAIGYKIYRRNDYYGFFPDSCEIGVPSYTGYSLIETVSGLNTLTFLDDNNGLGLVPGIEYCYMVTAYYPDGAESYASLEVCTELKKDVPVMTNVSINATDVNNGSVYIAWSKPTDLDSTQTPPPYRYDIYRANNFTGSNMVFVQSLNDLNDTTFVDTLLNTKDYPYTYKVELYDGNETYVGVSQVASSVFLKIKESDNQLNLVYEHYVPWTNDTFVIYRQNQLTLLFDSIGYSTDTMFSDSGLINGSTYCYKIKSIGSYSSAGFIDPIINYSQINCGTPLDTTSPCAPELTVYDSCEVIRNHLAWTNPNNTCSDDVVQYNIYYAETSNEDLNLIYSIIIITDTFYIHSNGNSIAGCYAVTAVDSFSNESDFSNIACVDNCPEYELPNVFTPNDDGSNDIYSPFPFQFIEDIDLKIYNRWGTIVFETTDPDIMWDGKDKNTHTDCSAGVYYYVCNVNELRLTGIESKPLTGFIHLFRD
jgi:gliding motility-associated-like protein